MDKFLLSIAIPTYNRADLLSKTLDSVCQQVSNVASQLEIVISNNASTDHTRQVVEKYRTKFQNFRYHENETNTGADANIAQAFQLASGTYTWVFSDDDLLLPNTLENIIATLSAMDIGVLFLTPKWYYSHAEDVELIDEPFACQVYDNSLVYLQEINVLVTFITSIIVNKSLLIGLNDLYIYQGTNLIQLGWTLPAIFKARQNAKVASTVVLAQGVDEQVSYSFFRVHGTNFNLVLNGLVTSGRIPSQARDIINYHLITQFFPIYISPKRRFVNNEQPFSTLLSLYWRYAAFWQTLAPIFLRRLYLPTLAKANLVIKELAAKTFKKIGAISARQQIAQTGAALQKLGGQSQLPVSCFLQNPQCITIGRRFQAQNGLR
ncbi:MAG: glycosyltransferase family 2 protein, partial [Sphingobacteriaceae bacterium]